MTKNCSCKTCYNPATQTHGEHTASRVLKRLALRLREGSEDRFVTKFIDCKLPNRVRNLPEGEIRRPLSKYHFSTYLHRIGIKPAYNCLIPSSRARRVNPETRPVAYPLSDTRRIRVASSGVSNMSAKNLSQKTYV